jgi:thiol-disulfide isomerase/thioredoxin
MKHKIKMLVPVILIVAAGALVWFWVSRTRQSQTNPQTTLFLAPDFTLTDLDGKTLQLSDFKDRPVLLNFWATWCPPCRAEIPSIEEIHRNHASSDGLVIIGISLDSTGVQAVKEFVKEANMTYRIAMGTEKIVQDYGNIQGIPATFLINRKGEVVRKLVGYQSHEALEKAVKEIL